MDIISHSSGRIYAPKGAEVELIRDGEQCIFEYKGERFSCKRELLGDEIPLAEIIKPDDTGQVNLF